MRYLWERACPRRTQHGSRHRLRRCSRARPLPQEQQRCQYLTATRKELGQFTLAGLCLQSLVQVNYSQASGGQMYALARRIQADILERFGVALEMEPNLY